MSIHKHFELDSDRIKKSVLLGKGAFGLVYKGVYYDPACPKLVAIKTCKNHNDDEESKNLLQEASILQDLHQDHILTAYGICAKPTTMLVMEYAEFGELGEYLKVNQAHLDSQTLILYMYQISTALVYLEFKNYIHRDIAARNVLVLNPRCVKLADFGFARRLENDVYIGKYYKLPIKWMSPESIKYFIFSTASDIWMFGVCIWEIMMYGVTPYRGLTTEETIQKIVNKKTLSIPDGYPMKLKQLLTICWSFKPCDRPKPKQVEAELRYIYTHMEEDEIDCGCQNAQRIRMEDLTLNSEEKDFNGKNSNQNINWILSSYYKPKQSESEKYTAFDDIYQTFTPVKTSKNSEIYKILDVGDKLEEILEKQLKDSEEDAKWLEECEKQFVFA